MLNLTVTCTMKTLPFWAGGSNIPADVHLAIFANLVFHIGSTALDPGLYRGDGWMLSIFTMYMHICTW